MRADMAKVIVERPRIDRYSNGKISRQHPRHIPTRLSEEVDYPSRISMKGYWAQHKELNENLRPLERFLRARVGQKWDDVYAEISQKLNYRSTVQYHVFQHLDEMVEKNTRMIDGVLHDSQGRRLSSVWYGLFYVHPVTGRLGRFERKRPKWSYRDAEQDIRWKNNNPSSRVQYRQIEEIWYEITLEPMAATKVLPMLDPAKVWSKYDVMTKTYFKPCSRDLRARELTAMYGDTLYSVAKRQLNKREIKKLGLNK